MRTIKSLLVGSVLAVGAFVSFGLLNPLPTPVDAADCSSNAVVKCGVTSVADLRAKYKANATRDLDDLFAHYGLTAAVINGATVKSGTVYKDGRLVVDGKVVGTGARSVGREYIPGSTSFTAGGTTFYERSTQVSMLSGSLAVYVFYDANGRVIAAVMLDCGNPVTVKVVEQPVYRCDALTAKKISRDTYDFSVAYTAKNGAAFKSYSLNYGDGTSVSGRTVNPTRHTYTKPGTYTTTATVYFTVDGVSKSATCTAKVTVDQDPAYKCDLLQMTKKSRTEFTFMPKYTATGGATFKNYTLNLGDGTTKNGLTSAYTHAYANPGTYKIAATLTFNVGTTAVTANCSATVTVEKPPVVDKPSVSIEKTVNGKENEIVEVGKPFTYEVTVTNTGNVALKDAVITDKAPANITFKSADAGTVANNTWTHKVTLAVKESKTFKITAVLDKYVAGEIVNKACVDATEVNGNPDDCDTAVVTTPKEDEIIVCVIEDKTIKTIKESAFDENTMTKDLSACDEETPAPVTELPRTGAGEILGGSLGLGSLAGAVYYYRDSRRRFAEAMSRR